MSLQLLAVKDQPFNGFGSTVLDIAAGDQVGLTFDHLFCLPHGNRQPGHFKHRRIIATIADGCRLLQRHPKVRSQGFQGIALLAFIAVISR